MSRLDILKEKVRSLPDLPGVYLLKDEQKRIIYVGKARSLKQRVRSYLADAGTLAPRLQSLQLKWADLDYVVTDSEVEALILECNLIKEYRPRFNVNLKDDKDYPYLLITPELYPRLELLRLSQKSSKRARYKAYPERAERRFGPYTDVGAVRETMNILAALFPLRRCRQPLDGRPSVERPCLNHQMKRCLAPCQGEAVVSQQEYQQLVRQVELFLQGRQNELESRLKKEMAEAAGAARFEEAAVLRDRLQSLQRVAGQQQKMTLAEKSPDRDLLALARFAERAAVHLFQIRDGKLLSQEHFSLLGAADYDDSEAMGSFLKSYYNRVEEFPAEILLSVKPTEADLLAEWLKVKAGRVVKLHVPRRGALKKLVDLAARNSLLRLQEEAEQKKRRTGEPLQELGRLVGLEVGLDRIEAYDISHQSGRETVGAMVVFSDGEADKAEYRRFNIKKARPGDDYGALQETLARRAVRSGWPVPDLILIDGGKGQLSAARQALVETNLQHVPLAALAKNPDHLFIEGENLPIRFAAADPLLQLLQRIRDEVHRFAVSGHRQRKTRRLISSGLEKIPGIGPKRRTALLAHFGSAARVRQASAEELSAVPGISPTLAAEIHTHLHSLS